MTVWFLLRLSNQNCLDCVYTSAL